MANPRANHHTPKYSACLLKYHDAMEHFIPFQAAVFGEHCFPPGWKDVRSTQLAVVETSEESKKEHSDSAESCPVSVFIPNSHQNVRERRIHSPGLHMRCGTVVNSRDLKITIIKTGVTLGRRVPLYLASFASHSCLHENALLRASSIASCCADCSEDFDELELAEIRGGVVDGVHVQDDQDSSDMIPFYTWLHPLLSDSLSKQRDPFGTTRALNSESTSLLHLRNMELVCEQNELLDTVDQIGGKVANSLHDLIVVKSSSGENENGNDPCLERSKHENGKLGQYSKADSQMTTNTVPCMLQKPHKFVLPTVEEGPRAITDVETSIKPKHDITQNKYQRNSENVDDACGTTNADLHKHLEEILYLLPSINRRSKSVQDILHGLLEDVNIILGLPPNHVSDDDKPCGEDRKKEKLESTAGLFSYGVACY